MEVPTEMTGVSTLNNNRNSIISTHSVSWERLALKPCWHYHTTMHKPSPNLKEFADSSENISMLALSTLVSNNNDQMWNSKKLLTNANQKGWQRVGNVCTNPLAWESLYNCNWMWVSSDQKKRLYTNWKMTSLKLLIFLCSGKIVHTMWAITEVTH